MSRHMWEPATKVYERCVRCRIAQKGWPGNFKYFGLDGSYIGRLAGNCLGRHFPLSWETWSKQHPIKEA